MNNLFRKNMVFVIIISLIGISFAPNLGANNGINDILNPEDSITNNVFCISDLECSHTTMYVDDDNIKEPLKSTSSGIFISSGTTLYVGGSGPDNYTKIQDAIDNASDGDTIFVYSGTYFEHVVVDKQVYLIGEDKETTIIDGEGVDDVVFIDADGIIIENLTIQNSGIGYGEFYTNSGVELTHAHYCEIRNCIFQNNTAGVGICYSSYNLIEQCVIENNHYGFRLSESEEPYYESCRGNIISKNLIQNNTGYGISCAHTVAYHRSNVIQCNTIKNNGGGIFLYVAKGNEIIYNDIINNTGSGVYIYSCMATSHLNLIHHNNFIDNNEGDVQAYDITFGTGINYWYFPQPELGNYWSDYTGYDSDDDGVGDTPYEIPDEEGITNQDEYPLMHRFVIGDMNVDGIVNDDDIEPFYLAIEDPEAYMEQYSIQSIIHGDIDQDGVFTNIDGGLFFSLLEDPDSWMPPENQPPFEPHDPFPVHYATDVINHVELNWTGGDPDDVIVTYDVYFGETSNPPKVKSNQSDTYYDPGILEYNKKYYWQIVAWDNHEVSTPGSIWAFKTESGPIPSVVYIDDDFDSSVFGFGYDHFNTIQDGIDAIAEQGTVYVAAGLYEDVIISKPLNLIGEDKLTTIIEKDISGPVCKVAADDVMIRGFTVTRNEQITISLNDIGIDISANHVIISDSIISKHSFGIRVHDEVTDLMIIENTFANNAYGVKIDQSCFDNHMFHNNFLDNSQHAFDAGVNHWNDSYPSGGNYWDDYTGDDEFSGPDQDEPGSDGVGDTPYSIPGGSNIDEYPLITISEPITIVFVDADFDSSTSGWQIDHFNSIQNGIDAVAEHGIVYVASGMYREPVIIQKSLQLIGENKTSTTVQWNENGDVIEVRGNGVTISRLTITHNSSPGRDYDAGIAIHSDSNVIVDTVITNNSKGLRLSNDASDSMIVDNFFENNAYGIKIDASCTDNKIFHNNFLDNTLHAFDEGNNIWDNGYPSGGNYWDDFIYNPGYPDCYQVPGGDNQDRYPLMDVSLSTTVSFVNEDFTDCTPGWQIDHFDNIQDGVDAVPDYGIVFVYNGVYNEHFVIAKPLSLIGEDKYSTIIDADQKYVDVIYVLSDSVTIKDFTIQNSQASTNDAGIKIRSNNNVITDTIVRWNFYGIRLDDVPESNNIFMNNILQENQYDGLTMYDCGNITIQNNVFTKNDYYGLSFSRSTNILVEDNTFFDDKGLHVWKSYNNTFVNNTMNGKPLVVLEGQSDQAIQDAGQVILINCSNITIQDQEITGLHEGIFLMNSHNCFIINNTLLYGDRGIFVWESCNATITDNMLGFNEYGIVISSSSNFTKIIHNDLYKNQYSIDTYSNSHHLLISRNTIIGSVDSYRGLDISSSNNGIITGNTIKDFYYGIEVTSSYDNTFYHNTLVNNYINVRDHDGGNIWDNGYPSGGNYWDDYTGSDSDGDGIGDTPYQLYGISSKDWYPLVNHFVLGDMNVDSYLNDDDIDPFILALSDPDQYMSEYDMHPLIHGDINQDGVLNDSDYDAFILLLLDDINTPPIIPMNPYPDDGETITSFSGISWVSGDVDPFDNVGFDVYFGTTPLPPQVAANRSLTWYDPDVIIESRTTYYWRVVAWDNHGASSPGPLWSFTTGDLSWYAYTVDSSGEVGMYSSLALDSDNHPHISYYDAQNDDLKYAYWTGSEWSIETVDSTRGQYTSIALDSNNYPHISYGGNDLKYAHWTGYSWVIETVDSWASSKYTSIALDSNNRPHISYYNFFDLKYAKWTGSSWSIVTVDEDVGFGQYTSIALDTKDHPHISYQGRSYSSYYLKYATWTGSSWVIEGIDSIESSGGYTSIALDSLNHPHISYYDATNNDLKYTTWTGSSWAIETVDTGGAVGLYTSIAVDSFDHPHISYWDASNQKTKYATWTGFTWLIETVDSRGENGRYTSIALDTSDTPHICYFDSTFYDLRYAKKIS